MSLHLIRGPEHSGPIESLAARLGSRGGGRVRLADLAGDLDRRARRTLAPGLAARRAFTWQRSDRLDPTWFPQGVATSWHTGHGAQTGHGADLLLVSWYSKNGEGSRISVLDPLTGDYRHVLLVEADPGAPGGFRPLTIHAGGLVWHGQWIHVAATKRGFFSCSLGDLLHDPSAVSGYAYLLPVRLHHQASTGDGVAASAGMRFSFLSLDRSGDTPMLLAGEYGRGSATTRLVHYGVAELESPSGTAIGTVAGTGPIQMQGAVVVDGVYYLTVSHGSRAPGEVVVGRPGAWTRRRFRTPPGPEDLVFHPPTDRFWSVTEHPGRRWIFSMPRRALRA